MTIEIKMLIQHARVDKNDKQNKVEILLKYNIEIR